MKQGFLSKALKAFKKRLIYAITRGDMIPYGTASLNRHNHLTNLHPHRLQYGAEEVDSHHDDQGSRTWFRYRFSEDSRPMKKVNRGKLGHTEEGLMASCLRRIRWTMTCVDFEMPLRRWPITES